MYVSLGSQGALVLYSERHILASTTQLQHHVNGGPCYNVVMLQSLVIRELFSGMNETNLIDLNALLFLERLFDGQDFVFWLKVKGLFAARQSLDENL
jgi:hypothetical protein